MAKGKPEAKGKPDEHPAGEAGEENQDRPAARARTVTVTIHSGERDEDKGDVFVGVNGRGYLIKRETEVDLPEEVVGALENAVVEVDAKNDGKPVQGKYRRYNMTIRR